VRWWLYVALPVYAVSAHVVCCSLVYCTPAFVGGGVVCLASRPDTPAITLVFLGHSLAQFVLPSANKGVWVCGCVHLSVSPVFVCVKGARPCLCVEIQLCECPVRVTACVCVCASDRVSLLCPSCLNSAWQAETFPPAPTDATRPSTDRSIAARFSHMSAFQPDNSSTRWVSKTSMNVWAYVSQEGGKQINTCQGNH